MQIVINGRFLTQSTTGVQRYARELTAALDALLDAHPDVTVTVLSPRLSDRPPAWRNIVVRQVGSLRGHAWEQLELPWYSRGQVLFCPGNTAPIVSLLSAQPVIVTVHDLSYRYFPQAYQWAFRLWYGLVIPLALRRARAVITVSEAERRAMLAHYPKAAPRLHAIANGGLPSGLTVAGPEEARDGSILYVGSFSKRKNFPRLLEAASRLARKRGFHFVFVGGTSRSLTASAATLADDVAAQITHVDAVDDPAALMQYYRKATCFLFPSLYESSGLPPIEAMACGCPVVVSDIPALQERCGDAALYCDPADIDSITATVERVMDDAALRAQLAQRGRQQAARFSWERCAAQTLDLIRSTADNSNPPRHAA